MTDREIGLMLKLIAHNANDQWLAINGKVVTSKGSRPVWKVTKLDNGQELVDEFQGLLAHAKMLDRLANDFLGLQPAQAINPLAAEDEM